MFYWRTTPPCRPGVQSRENLLRVRISLAIGASTIWKVAAAMDEQRGQTVGSAPKLKPRQRAFAKRLLVRRAVPDIGCWHFSDIPATPNHDVIRHTASFRSVHRIDPLLQD